MKSAGTAKAASIQPERAGGRQLSLLWLQGLLCGGIVALAAPLALLLAVLLAPGLAMALLDREPGKPVARSVALFALAASVRPIGAFWSAGHAMPDALRIAFDARIVGTAWAAAAVGWLAVELAPIVTRAALDAVSLAQTQNLRGRRSRLREEWALGAPDQAAPTSEG